MTSAADRAVDELREAYLQIFEEQQMAHKYEPLWFRGQFEEAAKIMLKEGYEVEHGDMTSEFALQHNGALTEVEDRRVVLVGRMPNCDLTVDRPEISRLHAMIVLVPEFNEMVVIDMGTLNGVQCLQRGDSGKACPHSRPHNRSIMYFGLDETCSLDLAGQTVILNPKICLVCFERPRERVLNCGHCVACGPCCGRVEHCPVCRVKIETRVPVREGYFRATMSFVSTDAPVHGWKLKKAEQF